MLYGAPEVPGQEKEPVQRVAHIHFCLHVYFKVSAAWYCSHFLPPVMLILVAICHRLVDSCGKFAAGMLDTGGKFATGVNNTSGTGGKICRQCRWYRCHWHRWQICHRCRWHRWCTLICEYLREFLKKFETVLIKFSGARGKLIRWKKPDAKNLVTLSL